jgi:hypothetical protein
MEQAKAPNASRFAEVQFGQEHDAESQESFARFGQILDQIWHDGHTSANQEAFGAKALLTSADVLQNARFEKPAAKQSKAEPSTLHVPQNHILLAFMLS